VVIPSGPSEVDAEVFFGTLCPLPALVFGGGRVSALDPPVKTSRFPPLGGDDALVVLPIPLAAAAAVAAEVAAAEVASTMVVGLLDTACTSQLETRVLDVAANVCFTCQGELPPFICMHA
jgi:hypothetical protein